MFDKILGGLLKAQLPAILAELKTQAPALIKEYLPKLVEEHKDKFPEYIEAGKEMALNFLRQFDEDNNGIPDVDEYKGEFDEAAGHLHALSNVVARVYSRVQATKAKRLPKGVSDVKNPH